MVEFQVEGMDDVDAVESIVESIVSMVLSISGFIVIVEFVEVVKS